GARPARGRPGSRPWSARRRLTSAGAAGRRATNSLTNARGRPAGRPPGAAAPPVARVPAPPQAQPAKLLQPPRPEPGQVDGRGDGVQGLVGADVAGRLLAADVLLAGLEGEDEGPPPGRVQGLADQPAGQPPH